MTEQFIIKCMQLGVSNLTVDDYKKMYKSTIKLRLSVYYFKKNSTDMTNDESGFIYHNWMHLVEEAVDRLTEPDEFMTAHRLKLKLIQPNEN